MMRTWRLTATIVAFGLFVIWVLFGYRSHGQSQQLEPLDIIGGLFWPDSDTILFPIPHETNDRVKIYCRLNISTGTVQRLMEVDIDKVFLGPISPDGNLIAYGYGDTETPPEQAGLYVMKPDGTNARRVYPLTGSSFAWLPDSKTIAYFEYRFVELNGRLLSDPREFLVFVDIESGQEIGAIQIDQRPHCDSDVNPDKPPEESECAQRCDAGQPCVLEQDILRPGGTANFYFFPDGRHILFQGDIYNNFFVFDLATLTSEQISFFSEGAPMPYPGDFELSPDGTAIAFVLWGIAVIDLQNGTLWELQEPLVPNEPWSTQMSPTWSRDSQWIAFTRTTVFPPVKDESWPCEEIVTESVNQIWVVSRDGQQVRLVADLWEDSNGQIVNLASNWPEEKRYYVGKVKVTKLAWKLPSSLRSVWRKPSERRISWAIALIGFAVSLSVLVWFGVRRYRNNHRLKR